MLVWFKTLMAEALIKLKLKKAWRKISNNSTILPDNIKEHNLAYQPVVRKHFNFIISRSIQFPNKSSP